MLDKFGSDPQQSHAIPGHYYFDPDIYSREFPAIFFKTWLYAGHVSTLANPGDYMVRDVGDQSVIILRDRGDTLRGYHNVCQHRAHRLLEGEGRIKTLLSCPYHAWAYDFSGELIRIPGEDVGVGIDKSGICLSTVRIEEFLGFIFFNLDTNATPLASQLTGMNDEFRSFCAEPEKLKRAYTKTYEVKANWKNVIENYSECYHCPPAHPTLAQNALDMTDYRIEVRGAYHHHNSGNRGDMQGYDINIGDSPRADEFGGWYLYPGVSFEFYPGGKLTVFHNVPDGPEKTIQNIEWYLGADTPTEEEQAVIDFVDVVRREDFPLVESVQRGLHSQGYGRGRFAIDKDRTYLSEHAVHDLQHKVLTALGDIAASDNSA
ncbi:MAG: aromatic ring-hydroxylating dioxygenase subunit alpha [Rhodospirillales bacterium]|jgi:carnitine monooxygenase subunit|nr:aromatic ring-hydroxylating dioxygenase subunit alpha [Rhodospirillales bacterium]MBT4628024.1 aromatic ring-hydroxylating dioxygenase subunit alpha [Rhodospirillales bacterium]MBT5351696.1 aromatic ring-hydroxylating dioxygenase subunit alpha [Rhodospirillales bacterium]MBT5520884.1 aromatic ring-hydroxylating dioxygenase subunit alpha [Rhodospirillales bacterium]MBT6111892.1 aromatic ring-hydroxylating dioxygenase subunit alpha [Rhodospirillales bacterium]